MFSSRIVPVATRPSTAARYASGEPNARVGPEVGQRDQTCDRKLAYPLSWPCQKGEFVLSARSVASHGPIRSSTATPSVSSATATCTWQPLVSCSRAVRPNAARASR
ncbi:Uncharacterised protein [Mycobacteroides abscessus]|nr:Uncharacterised protein [Mycobacteroides abscessus]